jgi:hypothetical protein
VGCLTIKKPPLKGVSSNFGAQAGIENLLFKILKALFTGLKRDVF